jgi:hypothetical protein
MVDVNIRNADLSHLNISWIVIVANQDPGFCQALSPKRQVFEYARLRGRTDEVNPADRKQPRCEGLRRFPYWKISGYYQSV